VPAAPEQQRCDDEEEGEKPDERFFRGTDHRRTRFGFFFAPEIVSLPLARLP